MASETSPMMKQYWELKKQHPNAILFFRVGDFYEMFHDDAVFASKILEIALTSRDKNKENAIPLCGVPFHAASAYIHKLIRAGHSVAICEQVEDPAQAKGIVQREVLRVITPGTLIEPELLSPKENNYVAALHWDKKQSSPSMKGIGIAFMDLSTGEFRFCRADSLEEVEGVLSKINPREVVLSEDGKGQPPPGAFLEDKAIRYVSARYFLKDEAYRLLTQHFQAHSITAIGEEGSDLIAAGALLAHVKEAQKGVMGTITTLQPYTLHNLMRIHPLAQQHLHLVPSGDTKEGTLLQVIDKTVTAMGGRLLRHWLLHPLLSPAEIIKRQEGVSFFHKNHALRLSLRDSMKKMADIERLLGRISLNAANPRDLIALKTSLFILPEIFKKVGSEVGTPTAVGVPTWDNLDDVAGIIDRAICPDPPLSMKDGGVICEGYLPALDEIRAFQKDARSTLTGIELRERQRTGIESLKVRYNQVFGYYIEVTETHLKKIPPDYIRKQTLTRAERFTTPELTEVEDRLLGADEKICRLEAEVFKKVCESVSCQARRIQEMSSKIATLDLFLSFAEVAHQNRYTCPVVNDDLVIRIVEGKHPVLDKRLSFVPNDTFFDPPDSQLMLITGPNMAGKSTYMQQVALIVLMAQIGSFVPASEATIGVVDQIFTRVGAADALIRGMSTFMVEMTEMAQILRQATPRSLILLDELGRGTSTFDGISIAWAIAEHIHRHGARTLFATHYHELTQLPRSHTGIRNYHFLVREYKDEIVFLRRITEGGADRSYGIEVGRLAGLPPEIIKRAKIILGELTAIDLRSPLSSLSPGTSPVQEDLFAAPPPLPAISPVLKALQAIDPTAITPMQAIQILADLAEQARKEI